MRYIRHAMAQTDRRRSPRIPAELRVELQHLGRPDDSPAELTRNLSAGGVFVDTSVVLPIGTEVAIEIMPGKGTDPVRLRTVVARIEYADAEPASDCAAQVRGMGLRFIGAEPGEIRRLIALADGGAA